MAGRYFVQLRHIPGAAITGHRASCMESAARGGVNRTGNIAFKSRALIFEFFAADFGDGRQQRLCIRMNRIFKQLSLVGNFDDFSQLHDGDAI